MSDETPETVFFHGYPTEQAEAFFGVQLDFIDCLCHLGMIWRQQWNSEPETIPLEADIRGV